jgi:hypothetical protein
MARPWSERSFGLNPMTRRCAAAGMKRPRACLRGSAATTTVPEADPAPRVGAVVPHLTRPRVSGLKPVRTEHGVGGRQGLSREFA